MRSNTNPWKRTCALSLFALLLAGCSDAGRQRWNDFWGLDSARQTPVVRSTPARKHVKAASPSARRSRVRARPGDHRNKQSDQVAGKVDRYVESLPASRRYSYDPDELMSKIKRQEDQNRSQRVRQAVTRTKEHGKPPYESTVADRGLPTNGEPVDEQKKAGDESIVRTASTHERLSGSDTPPDQTAAQQTEKQKASEARGLANSPKHPIEALSSHIKTPQNKPVAGASDIGAAHPAEATQKPTAAEEPIDKPELANVEITMAPDSLLDASKSEKAAPEVESKTEVKPNTPIQTPSLTQDKPSDTFARRLQEQIDRVSKDPNNVEEQYRLRLMYLINGQDEKSLAPIDGVNEEIEDIILAQIKSLIAARTSSGRDPATWANRQLDSIEALRRKVRSRADLRIPKVALCTAIEGFGRYTPIDPPEFPAGRRNLVLVYIEVDNFTSRLMPSGQYRTLLSVRQTLLTSSGQELWSKRDENIEDMSRQKRRDFYLTIGPTAIPKSLALGEYLLKVEVEDVLAGKINSQVARFKIVP